MAKLAARAQVSLERARTFKRCGPVTGVWRRRAPLKNAGTDGTTISGESGKTDEALLSCEL